MIFDQNSHSAMHCFGPQGIFFSCFESYMTLPFFKIALSCTLQVICFLAAGRSLRQLKELLLALISGTSQNC